MRANTSTRAPRSTSSPPRRWNRKSRRELRAPCSGRAGSVPPMTSAPKSASSPRNGRKSRHMDLNETRERIIYQKEGTIAKGKINWPQKHKPHEHKRAEGDD